MIIGITGTNGAGKGTVVERLVTKGFKHYSVRAELIKEIEKRKLPVDRSHMRSVANELRQNYGPYYFDELFINDARKNGIENFLIESLRVVAAAEHFKQDGGIIFAVDADRRLRYERIIARNSETDHITFEKFCAEEDIEMAQTEPWDMNVFGVIKMADAVFQNSGTREELYAQVDATIEKFTK